MNPVFGYCRVSGRGQLDGDGFARQQDTIRAYCERKGFTVLRWFFENAVSGDVETSDRPTYVEMLSLAGPATTSTIVVERADRLARNLAVCELACEEAREGGVTILEAASDTDLTNSDDPTRVLIRQVLGALAEWNKNSLVKRLKAARDRIRRETGRCGGGIPYGRTKEERKVIEQIVVLHDNWGLSFREIAANFNEMKPGFGGPKHKVAPPKGGAVWRPSTIHYFYKRVKSSEQIKESSDDSEQPKRNPKGRDARLLAGLPVSEM